jgi:dimethylamine/trimethylamine dehydrogenase
VTLAEAGTELGGRVNAESRLPGLSEWIRVRDYRVQQIQKMPNVQVYLDSTLDAQQVLEFGFQHVCMATGARWRDDGRGRHRFAPIDGYPQQNMISPDQIMAGVTVDGPVVVYDDDHFYMGGLIAEQLRLAGHEVLLVTSAACLSPMTEASLEQGRIQSRALELGVELLVSREVTGFDGQAVTITCAYSGKTHTRQCKTLVPVTARDPQDDLYLQLSAAPDQYTSAGILSVERIGDCAAPGIIAQATHAGHRYARELGEQNIDTLRDRVVVGNA